MSKVTLLPTELHPRGDIAQTPSICIRVESIAEGPRHARVQIDIPDRNRNRKSEMAAKNAFFRHIEAIEAC